MDICIDFDGTCVTHDYPEIGKDIGAIPVLKDLVKNGHRLILFTMRSDHEFYIEDSIVKVRKSKRECLSDAVKWFKDNDITLYGIQANPTQHEWTTSKKAYGQLYIDDAALGIPLIINQEISNRPYVNWNDVRKILVNMNIL